MGHFDHFLPVVDNLEPEEELPSCSPKVYISNEEGALLSAMRDLREQSVELRKKLENSTPADREPMEAKLHELRAQWRELARCREQAFIRKMITLGHLPPNHPIG